MIKILVSGGSGLVGKSLANFIERKDTSNFAFIFVSSKDCDFRIEESVNTLFEKHANIHCVIHLANRVGGLYDNINNNYAMLIDNLKININIVEACRKFKVKRLINCLSTCVFGNDLEYPLTSAKMHDKCPDKSNEGYSFSKRILETSSKLLCESCSPIEIVNLIPCNLYGFFDNYNIEKGHIVPALVHKTFLAKRDNTDLHIKGDGSGLRQFVFSFDFARIIYEFINVKLKQNYNSLIVGPPANQEYCIKDVVDKIVKLYKFKGEIVYDSLYSNGQPKKTVNDLELLEYIPNFEFTPLDHGLRETIEYFVNNYDYVRN